MRDWAHMLTLVVPVGGRAAGEDRLGHVVRLTTVSPSPLANAAADWAPVAQFGCRTGDHRYGIEGQVDHGCRGWARHRCQLVVCMVGFCLGVARPGAPARREGRA